jgi:hypothetical protein
MNLPKVQANPAILEFISMIGETQEIGEAIGHLESLIKAHLWPNATELHAEVIGNLLAIATLNLEAKGLRSIEVLQGMWEEGFNRRLDSSIPLTVVGAMAFLRCLIFQQNVAPLLKRGAEIADKYLLLTYPFDVNPVFGIDDIY